MINTFLHIGLDSVKARWFKIIQGAFFIFALVASSVLCFFYGTSEVKRSFVLLAASVFALPTLRLLQELHLIQRVALLYIVEMQFNHLSQQFVNIRLSDRNISISLALITLMPLLAVFLCGRLLKDQRFNKETCDVLKSWGLVFGMIIFHMLVLFLMLKSYYNYGYEYDLNIMANICLYFLVFIFSWDMLANIWLRRATATISTAYLIGVTILHRF